MKKLIFSLIISFFSLQFVVFAQVENINIYHPVYKFLERLELLGLTETYNLNDLPLRKGVIMDILNNADKNKESLSPSDINTLNLYLSEFDNLNIQSASIFKSNSDSNQVLSVEMLSKKEKFIYLYRDSTTFTSIKPLGSLDMIAVSNDTSQFSRSLIGNLGFRFSGTINNQIGYNLQATNGILLNGNRDLVLYDPKYSKNVKFIYYKSDLDFTESHVNYQKDWFNASIGREYRLTGAAYFNRFILSDFSTSFDAISLGADFSGFKYKFTHASLLGFVNKAGTWETGFGISIPPKYLAMHRFSVNGYWGEFSFFETVVYSDRQIDLAYLNPLSFFKSLEHALRDRDNSGIGLDFTYRFLDIFQLKGTYFLDDVRFEMIGKEYWGNKSSVNIGLGAAIPYGFDLKAEYARVEPYTYSHFNRQNAMVNDGYLFSSSLLPNSDRISLGIVWWFSERYPIEFEYSYTRHGENIYDSEGNIIRNVGGDPLFTKLAEDSDVVQFLDGEQQQTSNLKLVLLMK